MQTVKTLPDRLNASKALFALLLLGVFAVMLCGNFLTDKFADDFLYMYSFADGTPIRSFSGLLDSMRAHYQSMNGRLVAHFFVQIFEALPKHVFDVVNAGMFVGSLSLCYRTVSVGKKRSSFFLLSLFAAIWVFMPAFGQVNFWLDGACNYLWAQVAALLFFLPYARFLLEQPTFLEKGLSPRLILFALFAVPAGAYSENLSGAALFMAILCLLASRRIQKRSVPLWAGLPVLTGMVGYACMIFSPGERQNKNAGFSALRLLYQTEKVFDRFHVIRAIVIALVILFFLASALRIEKRRMLLSIILTCGGGGAGLIFALARFYPFRSLAGCMLLLTLACCVLLRELLEIDRTRRAALCLMTLLCLSVCYRVPHGMKDIYLTHTAVAENRETILREKAAGNLRVTVPIPVPETKYSAVEGLIYLSDTDDTLLSNAFMAKYYGVESILGTTETD
ncbi:MAG: hypothetical protein IJT44_05710 [Clostridia bacterium]|nr:hypothetical protein [Clostridia bacterium]